MRSTIISPNAVSDMVEFLASLAKVVPIIWDSGPRRILAWLDAVIEVKSTPEVDEPNFGDKRSWWLRRPTDLS